MTSIHIHPSDNVEVLLLPLGEIPAGHKIARSDIAKGDKIVKYGFPIGEATRDIAKGEWVHVHNVKTLLNASSEYSYHPLFHEPCDATEFSNSHFSGFLRKDGRAGIRNEVWIVPTVGCVNSVAQRLAQRAQDLAGEGVEGVYAFTHPYGCSQTGDDHARTRKLLASLCRHPNAGGVLVLGLGCENLTMDEFRRELGDVDGQRVRFLVCQDVPDEIETGMAVLAEIASVVGNDRREELPISKLAIGMKCGGSDGLSGITANPVVGRFSDMLVSLGGTTVLTEVPEMFGAEAMLFNRAQSEAVFGKAVKMVSDFKDYFTSHGEPVCENPSPGNKAGGITTLEDKSCGCVQKGGCAPVVDAVGYAERVTVPGLNLMSGPGNDLVSATALIASGCQLVLFTTGRGTPFGAPGPTLKISTNTALYEKKRNWIDFDAGRVAQGGESMDDCARRLMRKVLSVASGEKTLSEKNNAREIAIFKSGVTL